MGWARDSEHCFSDGQGRLDYGNIGGIMVVHKCMNTAISRCEASNRSNQRARSHCSLFLLAYFLVMSWSPSRPVDDEVLKSIRGSYRRNFLSSFNTFRGSCVGV